MKYYTIEFGTTEQVEIKAEQAFLYLLSFTQPVFIEYYGVRVEIVTMRSAIEMFKK